MQAGGKARLGNSHNQKPPLHGGHSLFLYLPLPSLQSNSSWPFRDETKKKKKKGMPEEVGGGCSWSFKGLQRLSYHQSR